MAQAGTAIARRQTGTVLVRPKPAAPTAAPTEAAPPAVAAGAGVEQPDPVFADPVLGGLSFAEIERLAQEALDGFRADWESGSCAPTVFVGPDPDVRRPPPATG